MDPGLETRPATLDDVPAIRALLAAHGNDGPVTTVDIVGPYLRHCVDHGRAFVTVDASGLVGYGATVDAGAATHLADLFVRPDRLGTGIGRPLLDTVFGDATRRTTFASDDPRALPLYVRAGMAPLWPSLYLEGDPASLPAQPASITSEPADASRLSALEGAWVGHPREHDHAYWVSLPAADTFVVTETGEPVAIGHARARQVGAARTVDRLLVRPGADPVAPVLAGLRRASRGGPVHLVVQGPSPLLPILLERGFRIVDRDTFMASDPALIDPARLIANGGLL
ncbi:MAG TPA: GNAT family N-acetyltransferase [Candidatus Limnocylindrales bacterium]|jgi:GNAT superfamily N-acetyltransferase